MSDPQPSKAQSSLTNPQVLTAIIGGVVTLIAAILGFLPSVLNRPPEATAVIVVTATSAPPTAAVIEPTLPSAPTDVPATDIAPATEAVVVIPTSAPPTETPAANVLLLWDDVSFTAINIGGGTLSLVGVTFSSAGGFWDARDWGPSLYNSVPSRDCLRLRDATAGQRNPPRECSNLYGLILVGAPAIFWRGGDSFDVLRDGQVAATCPVAAGRCEVYIG